jgi:hypothetical protein
MSFAAYAWLNERHDPNDEDSNQARRHGGTPRSKVTSREVGGLFLQEEKAPQTSLPIEHIMLDVFTIGPNPSASKSKKLYVKSLQVEPELLKSLCPKNIIESSIDVSSLPGKFTLSSTVDGAPIMDQFSQALLAGDLLDNQQVR